MPVTPFLTAPETPRSERTYVSEECRQNALKNRRESDWFGHSAGTTSAAPSNGGVSQQRSGRFPSAGRYTNDQHRSSRPTSARLFNGDEVNGEIVQVKHHSTAESRKNQEKLEAHNQDTWYKHGPEVPDPLPPSKNRPKSRRSDCREAKARLEGANTSDWFRHDHDVLLAVKANCRNGRPSSSSNSTPSLLEAKNRIGVPGDENMRKSNEFSSSIPWLLNDESKSVATIFSVSPQKPLSRPNRNDLSEPDSKPKGNARIISPDADNYHKRNTEGSTAQWYSHHDCGGAAGLSPGSEKPQHKPWKGTYEMATRLRGESEDWFSYREGSKSAGDLNLPLSSVDAAHSSPPSINNAIISNNSPEQQQQQVLQTGSNCDHLEENFLRLNANDSGNYLLYQKEKFNSSDLLSPDYPESSVGTNPTSPVANGMKHFVRLDGFLEASWLPDDVNNTF